MALADATRVGRIPAWIFKEIDRMQFDDLRLVQPLLNAVQAAGYTHPTPIQCMAIPHVLEGCDVLGCAQTGTGKTAAFALPILQRLSERSTGNKNRPGIRTLVLCPTRELAQQIHDSFSTYGRNTKLRQAVVFGGVNQNPQARAIRAGVDILVATPGRLLDLMSQGLVSLASVEILVLDEADRMLDMGFLPDIRRILVKVPSKRQTLLFSATMPDPIRKLAGDILNQAVSVAATRVSAPAETVSHFVYYVEKSDKPKLLTNLLTETPYTRALVFTRTKHGADKVVKYLTQNKISAVAIHGNKSQGARTRALAAFRSDDIPVLVATDIAARGLDVENISHVINYDLTTEPETYVHRTGRSGRAGASGIALSFCMSEEHDSLRAIERLLRAPLLPATNPVGYSATQEPRPRPLATTKEPARTKSSRTNATAGGGSGGRRTSRRRRPQRGGKTQRSGASA